MTTSVSEKSWTHCLDMPGICAKLLCPLRGRGGILDGFHWLFWKPYTTMSSYFTHSFVMTSRWSLFILVSLGQRSRSLWPWNVKMVSADYLENHLLVMTSRWALFIMGSLGQRLQWHWMSKCFPLNILYNYLSLSFHISYD